MTLTEIKAKAKKHGLILRKAERGEDSYMLVDMEKNYVATNPYSLPLATIEAWLNELDNLEDSEDEDNEDEDSESAILTNEEEADLQQGLLDVRRDIMDAVEMGVRKAFHAVGIDPNDNFAIIVTTEAQFAVQETFDKYFVRRP